MDLSRRQFMAAGAASTATGALALAGAAPAAAANPTLQRGDSGASVKSLQWQLSGLGYWVGAADGDFGSLTQQGVYALQKAAGLRRTGVVDTAEWLRLQSGLRPRAKYRTEDHVEIDLARQLAVFVRQNRVVLTLNTSTGSGERYYSGGSWKTARTPTGWFRIYRQVDGMRIAELGEMWRPKYFYQGWAIHGSTSIPPYPASHGCARVSYPAIDMLWAKGLLPMSRRVIVF